jgi:hypothetical protein
MQIGDFEEFRGSEKVVRGFFAVQKHKKVICRVVPGKLLADLMCSCGARVGSLAISRVQRAPLTHERIEERRTRQGRSLAEARADARGD